MDLASIPLFSMLRGRLSYLSQRQRVIAQNVANADTPGFAPRDLKPFTFKTQVESAASSQWNAPLGPHHIPIGHNRSGGGGATGQAGFKEIKGEITETTLDGNSVSLEDEMMKMTDARMNYDAAIGFYQKSLNLLRLAARPPGRG